MEGRWLTRSGRRARNSRNQGTTATGRGFMRPVRPVDEAGDAATGAGATVRQAVVATPFAHGAGAGAEDLRDLPAGQAAIGAPYAHAEILGASTHGPRGAAKARADLDVVHAAEVLNEEVRLRIGP